MVTLPVETPNRGDGSCVSACYSIISTYFHYTTCVLFVWSELIVQGFDSSRFSADRVEQEHYLSLGNGLNKNCLNDSNIHLDKLRHENVPLSGPLTRLERWPIRVPVLVAKTRAVSLSPFPVRHSRHQMNPSSVWPTRSGSDSILIVSRHLIANQYRTILSASSSGSGTGSSRFPLTVLASLGRSSACTI